MNIRRILLILLMSFMLTGLSAQRIEKYDTILVENCYKSYYSYNIKGPSFVIYKLYKGGGDVSRTSMYFKEKKGFEHFNYTKSGYDRGHLCPAEDFAYDEELMKATFYYYNAVPQTVKLNRGRWKSYETAIRNASQSDSLIIMCGGSNYSKGIPKKCFKVAYSLTTKEIKFCLLIDNDNDCSMIINKRSMIRRFTYKYIKNLYDKK